MPLTQLTTSVITVALLSLCNLYLGTVLILCVQPTGNKNSSNTSNSQTVSLFFQQNSAKNIIINFSFLQKMTTKYAPIVQLKSGKVRGLVIGANDGLYFYQGIRYGNDLEFYQRNLLKINVVSPRSSRTFLQACTC